MWRFFGLVTIALICVSGIVNVNEASANSDDSWVSSPIMKISETPSTLGSAGSTTCGDHMGVIEVRGDTGYKNACIFGSEFGTRIARYMNDTGVFIYAIAFVSDSTYVPLSGLCTGMPRCLYGQENDTFVYQMPVGPDTFTYAQVKDFTKHLTLHSGASSYYEFSHAEPYDYILAGELYVTTGVASVSPNGRWALIELPRYGFIRLDLKTLQYKRIAAHDSIPSQTNQRLESTISNDGRWVVIAGFTFDAMVYEVNDTCGDILTDSSTEYFFNETILCNSTAVGLHTLFPGVLQVHTPRFSADGNRLQLEILRNSQFSTITLSSRLVGTGNPYYLAFGDSFTSGEGETSDNYYSSATNTVTNHCHVSSRSYPYLLGNSWEILTTNLACSGSRIEGVQVASSHFMATPNGMWPTVVSLGVGGNDVDFMGKLKSCIGVGTCEWAKPGNRASTALEIKGLLPKMIAIINELKTNLAPTSVFIVGYPEVINDQSSAQCSVILSTLLDESERLYMNESIRYMNVVIKSAAEYTKVTYVDIEDAYQGERLCDSHEYAMNGVRYGDDIAVIPLLGDVKVIGAESFHPTPRGHQRAAAAINTKLTGFWESPYCNECQFSAGDVEPSTYWKEGVSVNSPLVRQLSKVFMKIQTFIQQTTAQFSFLPNTFAPGEIVKFELHSDVHQLGEFTASDDGSLDGKLILPSEIKGYHTIHAYGKGRSGEALDIYQTVYIDTTVSTGNADAGNSTSTTGSDSEVFMKPMSQGAYLFGNNTGEKEAGESIADVATNAPGASQLPIHTNVAVLGQSEDIPQPVKSVTSPSSRNYTGLLVWWGVVGLGVGVVTWRWFVKKK